MSFKLFRSLGFLLALAFLSESAISAQKVVLKGKIADAADDSPIPGVSIVIYRGKVKLKETISLANGTYEVEGLKRGDNLDAFYSRGGYKPNPLPSKVAISALQNTNNIALIKDTSDDKYWQVVSMKIKVSIESSAPKEDEQIKLYERSWFELLSVGLSPEAQTQAAKQLTFCAPRSNEAHPVTIFASMDDRTLQKAEGNINEAVEGMASLSNEPSIPSDVAIVIALDAFSKNPSPKLSPDAFSRKFDSVWGSDAGDKLRMKFEQQRCLQPSLRAQPGCPKSYGATDYLRILEQQQ
jgi:hypothetical protein